MADHCTKRPEACQVRRAAEIAPRIALHNHRCMLHTLIRSPPSLIHQDLTTWIDWRSLRHGEAWRQGRQDERNNITCASPLRRTPRLHCGVLRPVDGHVNLLHLRRVPVTRRGRRTCGQISNVVTWHPRKNTCSKTLIESLKAAIVNDTHYVAPTRKLARWSSD